MKAVNDTLICYLSYAVIAALATTIALMSYELWCVCNEYGTRLREADEAVKEFCSWCGGHEGEVIRVGNRSFVVEGCTDEPSCFRCCLLYYGEVLGNRSNYAWKFTDVGSACFVLCHAPHEYASGRLRAVNEVISKYSRALIAEVVTYVVVVAAVVFRSVCR